MEESGRARQWNHPASAPSSKARELPVGQQTALSTRVPRSNLLPSHPTAGHTDLVLSIAEGINTYRGVNDCRNEKR